MSLFKYSIIFLAMLCSKSLYAEMGRNILYAEPYAGYFLGNIDGSSTSTVTLTDTDISSLYYGLRLGFELKNGIFFGLEYGMGNGDVDVSGGTDGHYEQQDLGFLLGYRLNEYLRFYASYILKYDAELDWDDALGKDKVEGDGFSVGLTFKASSNVKIGFEYQYRSLKDYIDGSSIAGNPTSSAYLLNLRIPILIPFRVRPRVY